MSQSERRPRKAQNVTTAAATATEHSGHTTPTLESFAKETPVDYLFKNNVTSLVQESINSLILNRPQDPIKFLVDFFATSSNDAVNEACMKLSWSHFSKRAYQRNVLEVYNTLLVVENKDSNLCGLLGDRFNEVLSNVALDLPEEFREICMEKLKARSTQVVVFDRFYHSVLLLHVMKDFICTVQSVYCDLDLGNVGRSSEALCSLMLSRLKMNTCRQRQDSLTENFKKKMKISSEENENENLDDDAVLKRRMQDLIEPATCPEEVVYMEEKTFVEKAVEIFLNKV